MSQETVSKYGKLKLIFDEDEYFPNNPGDGTPVLVVYGDWEHTATYFAAIDWREVDEYQLSQKQWEWLDNQWPKVQKFYHRMEQEKPRTEEV